MRADSGQEALQARRATEGQTEADEGDAMPHGSEEGVRRAEGQGSDVPGAGAHGCVGKEAAEDVQAAAQTPAAGHHNEGTRTVGVRGVADAADGIDVRRGQASGATSRYYHPTMDPQAKSGDVPAATDGRRSSNMPSWALPGRWAEEVEAEEEAERRAAEAEGLLTARTVGVWRAVDTSRHEPPYDGAHHPTGTARGVEARGYPTGLRVRQLHDPWALPLDHFPYDDVEATRVRPFKVEARLDIPSLRRDGRCNSAGDLTGSVGDLFLLLWLH